ncbi:dr1-associated corepressor homolog [Cynara cardunculus var. scolymus]|uniref:Histone-fold n=3 Tax=Magnoliopsida TaxID=3398 RepID=A0A103XUZ1_CYNCS|nr:dr1-associated corepressor homolog [Cynara cardunculus var. scolymus]KVH97353.1 Histone-fold [Cynara cardunculus var. scolymus]
MKKKLDTRFPASRIKKIMQADEDVGKIAMAVPVLVSKALELFLQDLCDRTYDITLRRGAKTVNSLHLKHCVQSYNVFDFLREVVSKVPDYGHSDAGLDDRTMIKRKKAAAGEMNESDEELKRNRMNEARQTSSNGRGRGRGRPRGRGRGRGSAEREPPQMEVEPESRTSLIQQSSKQGMNLQGETTDNLESSKSMKGELAVGDGATTGGRDFDLNAGIDENTEKVSDALDGGASVQPPTPPPPQPVPGTGTGCSSSAEPAELKQEDYLGLSLSEMDRMAIDTHNLAQINSRLEEEDEDYDEE